MYVPGCEPLLDPGNGLVDLIEIEPQTLWQAAAREGPYGVSTSALDLLRSFPQPKLIHSVGDAVGGERVPDARSIAAINEAVQSFDAAWVSEHLSFTQVSHAGRALNTGFMLPPLQSEAGARAAARTIRRVAAQLSVPFLVETGVSYLRPRPGEMPDGEFVDQVVRQAPCGLLLDLHNIWTNERNGRQTVSAFLGSIPLEFVWEMHLAGGFELDGYWLDAHSGEVAPGLFELARETVSRLPNLRAITFEIFPSFVSVLGVSGIERQLRQLRELWESKPRGAAPVERQPVWSVAPRASAKPEPEPELLAPAHWEDTLGALVVGARVDGELSHALRSDPGVLLMQKLIVRFRAGAIAKAFPVLVKLLLLALGATKLEELLASYFASHPPERFALDEARIFAKFLRETGPYIDFLDDVIAYEEAQVVADVEERTAFAAFAHEPNQLLAALAVGRLPAALARGNFQVAVEPLSVSSASMAQTSASVRENSKQSRSS